MCLPFCRRQTRWGGGPGPVAIDQEVVYFDITVWRRFGRAPSLTEDEGRDHSTTGSPRMWKGSGMGLSGFGHATGSSLNTRHLRHRM